MSVIGSNIIAGASGQGGGYNLEKSLRFRSSASAYLSRTPASATDRQKFTWSGWVKRGSLGIYGQLFSARNSDNNNFGLLFYNDDTLYFADQTVPTYNIQFKTTQVFRDPSAHYHIVLAIDTTQATNTNRVKLYVNGSQVTAFSTATYPTQNLNTYVNTTNAHNIGAFTGGSNHFDGYITEVNFIDGQALTPSSFGETSATTGVWQPKRYAGTYGTNGFYLPFTDNSALTSGSNAGLGKDFSGNGNYWNTNNISITSGSTYDSMTDVPTLTSATAANFCVVSPIDNASLTISNGNLTTARATTAWAGARGSIAVSSGKYYWEVTSGGGSMQVGIFNIAYPLVADTASSAGAYIYNAGDGSKYNNGTPASYGATYTTNDVIGVALDMDNGTLTFYKNNVSQGTAWTGLSGTFTSVIGQYGTNTVQHNYGQRPFAYTPPTGFVALNTYNLPTPTIGATASTQANKYFAPVLYTGNATDNRAVSVGFQPDFVWIKDRSGASSHDLFDVIRGAGNLLYTNGTASETSGYYGLKSFTSDGFTLGNSNDNSNGNSYVSWNWKANGSGSSNTAGDIASTVSANTSAGFSVVTYNCPSSGSGNKTIGHGLGVAPAMIIVKSRNYTYGWDVYHQSLGYNASLVLNSTNGTRSGAFGANPTSTVFTATQTYTWDTNINYVAYCFAEVAGYSKFGKYTGNGNADGTFVYTGFRPKFVMIKRSDSGNNWFILDTSRDTYNLANRQLLPNSSAAESTGTDCNIDILSNGFKLRTALDASNGSGGTYIYACFAENPYKYSLAR